LRDEGNKRKSPEPSEDVEEEEVDSGNVEPANKKQKQDKGKEKVEDDEDEEESEEDFVQRTRNVILIRGYKNLFADVTNPIVERYDLDTIKFKRSENILKEIRLQVCCKNSTRASRYPAEMGLAIIERMLINNPLYQVKAQGLTSLVEDQEWMDIYNEMMLETCNLTYTKPAYRLGWYTLRQAVMLHRINSQLPMYGGGQAEASSSKPVAAVASGNLDTAKKDFDKFLDGIQGEEEEE